MLQSIVTANSFVTYCRSDDLLWLDWKFLTYYGWDFAQLLLALVRGSRPESTTVDRHIALNDAHQLNKVFLGKSGNEETLIRIFCTRSQQQLTATLNYYHQHYGHEFEKVGLLLSASCQDNLIQVKAYEGKHSFQQTIIWVWLQSHCCPILYVLSMFWIVLDYVNT